MTPLFHEMERISQRFTTAIRGITVVKTVWANDEGLSVVRFEISSDRDDPVRLRLVESVPSDFPMENIGPHPKYGGDKWTKKDDREFVYTDRLDSDGEAFTLYGIKGLSEGTLESFLTDAVVTIDPVGDESATDSDDVAIMTTEDTDNSELDDDTEQDDDFTRGGGSDDFTRGGGNGDFTRGAGGNFDDRIPRVEDLGSMSEGWGGEQSHQRQNPSDIQFVGSKTNTADHSEADEPRQPIELDDPVQTDDDSDESGAASDDSDTDVGTDDESSADETKAAVEGDVAEEEEFDPVENDDEAETETDEDDLAEVESDEDDLAEETDVDSEADDLDEQAETDDDEHAEVDRGPESDTGSLFDDGVETDDSESIVDALVSELSERDLSEDERAVLREALGRSEPTTLDVRLRHVQSRVDDLSAYIEALEEFLDENGTAEQVLDDLQTESEAMRADIETLESAVTASQEALETVERQVETLEDRMVDTTTFEARLDELDERLVSTSELEGELDELTDELATLRDDVETGKQWRSNLSQAIQLPGMMESDGGESESDEQ